MIEKPGTKLQAFLLVGLCIASSFALLKALGGGTPVPNRPEIVLKEGSLPGYRLKPQPNTSKAEGHDKAHGTVQRWLAIPEAEGTPLRLAVVHMQSRSHLGFSLEQLTRGATSPADLTISQPRVVALGASSEQTLQGSLISRSGQEAMEATQTCLVVAPGGKLRAGVSQHRLVDLVERSEVRHTPLAKLAQLTGLMAPLRWECTLVSVASTAKALQRKGNGGSQQPSEALETLIKVISQAQNSNAHQTLSQRSAQRAGVD